jgi:hypothetical protein
MEAIHSFAKPSRVAAYWAIQRTHFADFEPIVDFLHVLCYGYAAAWAVRAPAPARREQYVLTPAAIY